VKPELTQKEMERLTAEGKTAVWAYNTLYSIEFCQNLGRGEYYLRKVYQHPQKGIGVTGRGRFQCMTPEEASEFR